MSIAVIIAVGTYDDLLAPQLQAVLTQQVDRPFEVVLSVNTGDLVQQRAVSELVSSMGDSRVRLVDSTGRRSAAHARNVGVGASSDGVGLIAFCDADDLVRAGWLQSLVNALGGHAAVGGHLHDVYPDQRQAAWRPPATPGALPCFLGVPYLVTANMLIRRDAFELVEGFDVSLVRCEDIAISWALLQVGLTIGYAADAVVDYRHRSGLWRMLRQHELYGRGMSQVLTRYGIPRGDGWTAPRGSAMLRPNSQRAARRSFVGYLRRGAIAVGRVHGLVGERSARSKFQRTADRVGART